MPTLPARLPPVSDAVLRGRLARARAELHELEDRVSPGHVAGLADALDAVEAELASLGWSCPEAALTAHDEAVLDALDGAL
jgi:hypothetical protein